MAGFLARYWVPYGFASHAWDHLIDYEAKGGFLGKVE